MSIEIIIEELNSNENVFLENLSNSETFIHCLKKLNKISTSKDGYDKTIELLNKNRINKKDKNKFKCIVDALSSLLSGENVEDLIDILKFTNNLISPNLISVNERIQIRYDFIGLKIDDLLSHIKEKYKNENAIVEQINTFYNQKSIDESNFSTNDVDLNNSIEIFHTIYSQVLNTQIEYFFLCILRHLLKLDISNVLIWEIIEKLICRATCFDREENLINIASLERYSDEKLKNLTKSTKENKIESETFQSVSSNFSPPPAPPAPQAPPAPPPLSLMIPNKKNDLKLTINNKIDELKKDNSIFDKYSDQNNETNSEISKQDKELKLPQQCVPKPNHKLKQLTWSKIPTNRILGKENLWTKSLINENDLDIKDDQFFREIEQLFKINEFDTNMSLSNINHIKETKLWNNSEKINLIDSKRSLNINIFMKQFRCSPDEICEQLIKNNFKKELGLENLEGMLKILPDLNEIELLKSYTGEMDKLGEAEKFLLKLIQIPDYKLRIESLILKEEFSSQIFYFNKTFENIFKAVNAIINNSDLASLMLYICKTGNFLNDGAYCGNAAGFKLSSLIKLIDFKSNKHNFTLLHVIINQLEKENSKLLNLPNDILVYLKEVICINIENFRNEVLSFCNRVIKLDQQMISKTENYQIQDLREFVQIATKSINNLNRKEKDLIDFKCKLAEYFCEDPTNFKLEDCFNILFKFCEKMISINQENEKRFPNEFGRSSNLLNNKLNNSFDALNNSNSNFLYNNVLNNKSIESSDQLFKRNGSITARNSSNKMIFHNNWINSAIEKEKNKKNEQMKLKLDSEYLELDNPINLKENYLDSIISNDSYSFVRPTMSFSMRPSRKSTLNSYCRSTSPNNTCTNLPDSTSLLDFLNNNLESNREFKSFKSTHNNSEENLIKNNQFSTYNGNYDCQEIELNTKVKLRRSQSTNEVDQSFKTYHRKGITSVLLEENCNEDIRFNRYHNNNGNRNENNNDNYETHKSSGLRKLEEFKKLASMYKTFENDDFEITKTSNRSNRHNNIKYIDDSDNETKSTTTTTKTASTEVEKQSIQNVQSNAQNRLNYSSINRSKKLEAKLAFFESKTKDLNENNKHQENSCFNRNHKFRHTSQILIGTNSNIVSNRILKFENCNDDLNLKKVNSVKMITKDIQEPNTLSKSFSRDWDESLLSKNKKNYDSLKPRSNSVGNISSSDDNEVSSSKDDGFETQSNASSSSQSGEHKSLKEVIELNLNDQDLNSKIEKIISPLDEKSNKISNETNETNDLKQNFLIESKPKDTCFKKCKQTISKITNRSKTTMRPVSTIFTNYPRKLSCTINQNSSSINLNLKNSSGSNLSINETHRKKSESSSGLYLCYTVSAKAKTKSVNQQISNNKLSTLNINLSNSNSHFSNNVNDKKKTNIFKNSIQTSNKLANNSATSFKSHSSNEFNMNSINKNLEKNSSYNNLSSSASFNENKKNVSNLDESNQDRSQKSQKSVFERLTKSVNRNKNST